MTRRTWVLISALLGALFVLPGTSLRAQQGAAPAGGGAAAAPALIPPAVADKSVAEDEAKKKPKAPKATVPDGKPTATTGGEPSKEKAAAKGPEDVKRPAKKAATTKASDDKVPSKPTSVINAKDKVKDKPKTKVEAKDKKKADPKNKATWAPAQPKAKAAAPTPKKAKPKPKSKTKTKTKAKAKTTKKTAAKPKKPEVLPWAKKPGTSAKTTGATGAAYRAKASKTCKGLFEALCRETPACTWVADIRIEGGPDIKAHCMDQPGRKKKKTKKKKPSGSKTKAKKAAVTKPPAVKKPAAAKPVPKKPVKPVVEVPPATGTLTPPQ